MVIGPTYRDQRSTHLPNSYSYSKSTTSTRTRRFLRQLRDTRTQASTRYSYSKVKYSTPSLAFIVKSILNHVHVLLLATFLFQSLSPLDGCSSRSLNTLRNLGKSSLAITCSLVVTGRRAIYFPDEILTFPLKLWFPREYSHNFP